MRWEGIGVRDNGRLGSCESGAGHSTWGWRTSSQVNPVDGMALSDGAMEKGVGPRDGEYLIPLTCEAKTPPKRHLASVRFN